MANPCEIRLQVIEGLPQTAGRTCGGVELTATPALRIEPLCRVVDFSGDGGAIRHVMSSVNPQGCQVFSFKYPSATELNHDFLWRTTQCLPERGRIGIFNRSYYEEVLIAKVRPEILRSQTLPDELLNEKTIWQNRYRSILDLESHLYLYCNERYTNH